MSAAVNLAAGILAQVGLPGIWLLRQVLKVSLLSIGMAAGGVALFLIMLNGSLAELSTHLRVRMTSRSKQLVVNPETHAHLVTT